jgi:hypothetical protein
MTLHRELLSEVRSLDEHDLRRLLIFARGLLVSRHGVEEPETAERGKVTYRQERVRCGREGCTTCPHGPYWYGYWREGGRLRSRYIGKEPPRGPAPAD